VNPVFACEWITSTRRWQSYAARSCFVAALLGGLFVVRYGRQAPTTTALNGLAKLAELFFLALSGTQLAVVLLAAPAATAGAICVDRARGTLMHMLVTDLRAVEIVLGKLAARLTPVLLMLACTFPVLEILSLLGGVDPNALLGAFAVTVGVAVLACSLAMTFSLWAGKTHQALLGTYSVLFLWLLRPLAGPGWRRPAHPNRSFWLWRHTGRRAAWDGAITCRSWR
jgi:ABC-type transport system involved in multi-copper enzyme maturation permease subunit